MKKLMSIALAVLMIAALACAAAVAENEDESAGFERPDPDLWSGTWVCDRATIEMVWEEEGYRVMITWGSSAWDVTEWEYSCYFHEDTNTLVSMPFGMRTEVVYGDDGEIASFTEVYNDGEATFSFDEEGNLIWTDEKENAGEGMRFTRVPEEELLPGDDAQG